MTSTKVGGRNTCFASAPQIKEEAEDLKVPVGLENCFMRFDDKALGQVSTEYPVVLNVTVLTWRLPSQLTRATLDETFHITKSLTFFSMEDELFKVPHPSSKLTLALPAPKL